MRALILLMVVASALVALFVTAAVAGAPEQRTYTFTQSQLDRMQDELGETVRERERDAHEKGKQDMQERCPSLI